MSNGSDKAIAHGKDGKTSVVQLLENIDVEIIQYRWLMSSYYL